MRKHRIARLTAILIFLAALAYLILGLIAVLILGRSGLGAGWSSGWRGWLTIPAAIGVILGSTVLFAFGVVLFFLEQIDTNLRLARDRGWGLPRPQRTCRKPLFRLPQSRPNCPQTTSRRPRSKPARRPGCPAQTRPRVSLPRWLRLSHPRFMPRQRHQTSRKPTRRPSTTEQTHPITPFHVWGFLSSHSRTPSSFSSKTRVLDNLTSNACSVILSAEQKFGFIRWAIDDSRT